MRPASSAVVVLALAAGCGSGPEPRPTPPPTPPPVVPVRLEPCIPPATDAITLQTYATDAEVRFCVRRAVDADAAAAAPECYGVDLGSGAIHAGAVVPLQDELTPPFRARADVATGMVTVCPIGLDVTGCEVHAPKLGAREALVTAAVDDANTRLAYVVEPVGGGGAPEVVVHAIKEDKLGARLARFRVGDASYRCPELAWLDKTLFVSTSVCAGPSARGALWSDKGKKLVDVGAAPGDAADAPAHDTWGTRALPLGEGRWAFLAADGRAIVVHDAATGARVASIPIDAAPADAPAQLGWTRTPDGRLVVVAGPPELGAVRVVDTKAGVVHQVAPARACTPPP